MAHRGELVNYASGIIGDRARAEDVVQEAFLRFSDASARRLLDEPLGYLYRIVRNLALDGRRRQAHEERYLSSENDVDLSRTAEARPSPEVEAVDRAELRVVMEALAELPERTRLALEMHRFGGRKLREIAGRLGISVTLAHSLVAEAVEHCRERLRTRSRPPP
ncbi:MAG: sigma-70 family RNA polymerase sigma factor [Rhodospirillales bacterium]|nr:sigma-70 family RNA polymerase sigma factor [Rhodospirillales bacterium]